MQHYSSFKLPFVAKYEKVGGSKNIINKNENVHKERRIIKRTKTRRVMIRDKKIFLSNNIAKLDKDLNSEVKGHILRKAHGMVEEEVKQNVWRIDQ